MNANNFTVISRRYIQTVKPHTPLIRFRKGVPDQSSTKNIPNQSNVSKQMSTRPTLEDFQLPLKYRRRPLDEAEINAINSGGVY